MTKIILTTTALCLLFISGARAENHCFWDGREMHCMHGWTWQDRHEWREDEWRDRTRHRENDHDHDEWNYRR
jgi:hypothetical protein